MSYLELAKKFKNHKSRKLIAKILLKNAKRKGTITGIVPILNLEG